MLLNDKPTNLNCQLRKKSREMCLKGWREGSCTVYTAEIDWTERIISKMEGKGDLEEGALLQTSLLFEYTHNNNNNCLKLYCTQTQTLTTTTNREINLKYTVLYPSPQLLYSMLPMKFVVSSTTKFWYYCLASIFPVQYILCVELCTYYSEEATHSGLCTVVCVALKKFSFPSSSSSFLPYMYCTIAATCCCRYIFLFGHSPTPVYCTATTTSEHFKKHRHDHNTILH